MKTLGIVIFYYPTDEVWNRCKSLDKSSEFQILDLTEQDRKCHGAPACRKPQTAHRKRISEHAHQVGTRRLVLEQERKPLKPDKTVHRERIA